jgi:hypothetical protein
MLKSVCISVVAVSLLGACQTTKIETKPVSAALAPMEHTEFAVGTTWTWRKADGSVGVDTKIAADEASATYEDDKGCSWILPREPFAPAAQWNNCGRHASGTQTATLDGEIWPLEVGKSWSYPLTGSNSKGDNWEGVRKCNVAGEAQVTVPAGTFDTFHVICSDEWNENQFYMSPDLKTNVLFQRRSFKRGVEIYQELEAFTPAELSS